MNDFNLIAPVYDALVRLVFGNTLYQASTELSSSVPPGARVLVLGGGAGKLLPHLKRCQVVYLEKSSGMLEIARRRELIGEVEFVEVDFLTWNTDQQFDVVVCPFFLDVFTFENLKLALAKIKPMLHEEGQVMVTDFQITGKRHHTLLVKIMHIFFRLTAKLESRQLLPIRAVMKEEGYAEQKQTTYLNGLLFSALYTCSG